MEKFNHIAAKQLSDFFDGELSAKEKAQTERHVAVCLDCRKRLLTLETIRRTVLAVPDTSVSGALWDRIERSLPEKSKERSWEVPLISLYTSRTRKWAMAAAFTITISAGAWLIMNTANMTPNTGYPEVADSYGFDYGLYLAALTEPARMNEFEATYNRQLVSLQEAPLAANGSVAWSLLNDVPAGLNLKAIYVLTNDAAKSTQVTYGHDRAEIAIFRQPRGYPILFADFDLMPTTINGNLCLMAYDGRYCAYTFETEQAQYVVIGQRDDPVVSQVIDELFTAQ